MESNTPRQHHARLLYEGKTVGHHSCGICLAAAFGLIPTSYQSLRKGGITGEGECGAIKGGEMVLGEYLGDPHPTGAVTDTLREGILEYRRLLALEGLAPLSAITCNQLVRTYDDFQGDPRKAYCADLVVQIVGMVEKVLEQQGAHIKEPLRY